MNENTQAQTEENAPMDNEYLYETLRSIVRGAYDMQKVRIQLGNRVAATCRLQHSLPSKGKDNGSNVIELNSLANAITNAGDNDRVTDIMSIHHEESDVDEEKDNNLLMHIEKEFKDIMKKRVRLPTPRQFTPDEGVLISSYPFLVMVQGYISMLADEKQMFYNLDKVLCEIPVYNSWLKDVRGVGNAMAGVILSEFDIYKAKYVSSMWKYAGLDVVNGTGRSRKKEHLVESTYLDKEGNEQKKVGITFNPALKTKLIGVLGTSFVRQPANKCVYREIYDNYKHRLQHMPAHAEKSKGHINNMAIRYAIKQFLADLYREWKAAEGLVAQPTYAEAKLGYDHGVGQAKSRSRSRSRSR